MKTHTLSAALTALFFCAPALAAQAPDTTVVTGPNMQQVPIAQIMVTPTGGAQTTLGAALATGGSITIPTAALLAGNGTALTPVTLGTGLSITAGVLNSAGGGVTVPNAAVVSGNGTTFSAATTTGTGSTAVLSNAPTFTGLTTTAGIQDTGGINTTAASGYSQGGNLLGRYVGTIGSNPSVIFGTNAGTLVSPTQGLFSAFFGDQDGAVYIGTGEVAGFGPSTMAHLTTGVQDAAFGVGAMWWETTGGHDACVGSDTCRNTVGMSGITAIGQGAIYNWFASSIVAVGEGALQGNAQSVQITGTVAAGETFSGVVTLTGVTGSPFSWTYTTVSGDATPINLANHLCAVMAYNANPVGSYQCNPGTVTIGGVVIAYLQYTFDGTSTLGNIITVTATSTGTETITIGGGSVGLTNDCFGFQACQGFLASSASILTAVGHNVLEWVTTATQDTCGGYQSCQFLTSGSQNTAWGYNTLAVGSTAFGNSVYGVSAGAALSTGQNDNLYGVTSGTALTSATGNNFFGRQTGKLVTVGSNISLFGDLSGVALAAGAGPANEAFYGNSAGASVTTGANNTIVGSAVASTVLTTGAGNLILGTSTACTTPAAATAGEIILCSGTGGPSFTITGGATPATSLATVLGGLTVGPAIFSTVAAPTITSGFGTTPTISAGASTAWFQVTVGTGGTVSTGNIGMGATAAHGWACTAVDTTNPASSNTVATSAATNALTLTNYSRTTGAASPWTASDVITVGPCVGG